MKGFFLGCVLSAFCFMIMNTIVGNVPRTLITKEKTFVLDGKEWQCGYTPRQVDINLLEEQIQKIKNGN